MSDVGEDLERSGRVCYLEIPAVDVEASAAFYRHVFGWQARTRGDGVVAFDDTSGAVSGAWITGRPPSRDAGLVVYVRVDDAEAAGVRAVEGGGELVVPVDPDGPEIFVRVRDPAGNIIAAYAGPREG